jgi:hypothetical protein
MLNTSDESDEFFRGCKTCSAAQAPHPLKLLPLGLVRALLTQVLLSVHKTEMSTMNVMMLLVATIVFQQKT